MRAVKEFVVLFLVVVGASVALAGCVSEMDLTGEDAASYACLHDGDCLSGFVCQMRDGVEYGVCVPTPDASPDLSEDMNDGETSSSCGDGELNGDETDVDCGGSCPRCATNKACDQNSDCITSLCNEGTCTTAPTGFTCANDSDCDSDYCGAYPDGTGACGEPCEAGDTCAAAGDICVGTVCVPDTLCVEESPGRWNGPACDCATHCDPTATCTDMDTSLTCECPSGYEPEAMACVDIDECSDGGFCDPNGTCTNTDGSYECSCEPPYAGDGETCTCMDIVASAGMDQDFSAGVETSAVLNATAPEPWESGSWYIYATSPAGHEGTGSFVDINDPNTTFSGIRDVDYKLAWTVDNGCNTFEAYVHINFDPCNGARLIEDARDGTDYSVAPIRGRCWMTDYMKVGTQLMADGTMEEPQQDNGVIEKYCYQDDPMGCDTYGGFYTWGEAMQYGNNGEQGICPEGWKIPALAEFDSLGAGSAYELLHEDEHMSATNDLGFNGRLSGRHSQGATHCCRGNYGYHWTTECPNLPTCKAWKMYDSGAIDSPYDLAQNTAVIVRCIKVQ